MLLALIRHGIAEDVGPDPQFPDASRRLTDDGIANIRAACPGIRQMIRQPDAVLSSSYHRCVQTAQLICEELDVTLRAHNGLCPGATTDTVLGILSEYPDATTIAVCGHQPDLSFLVADLTGGSQVAFRRGTMCLIDLDALRPRAGTIIGIYAPEALRRMGRPTVS